MFLTKQFISKYMQYMHIGICIVVHKEEVCPSISIFCFCFILNFFFWRKEEICVLDLIHIRYLTQKHILFIIHRNFGQVSINSIQQDSYDTHPSPLSTLDSTFATFWCNAFLSLLIHGALYAQRYLLIVAVRSWMCSSIQ